MPLHKPAVRIYPPPCWKLTRDNASTLPDPLFARRFLLLPSTGLERSGAHGRRSTSYSAVLPHMTSTPHAQRRALSATAEI
jgi:hypothetical protein